jgi:hypothetical protein
MSLYRRRFKPLPESVSAHPPIAWVEPSQTAPPIWRRLLSVIELGVLVLILGVVLAAAIGIVLVGAFFLVDLIISG